MLPMSCFLHAKATLPAPAARLHIQALQVWPSVYMEIDMLLAATGHSDTVWRPVAFAHRMCPGFSTPGPRTVDHSYHCCVMQQVEHSRSDRDQDTAGFQWERTSRAAHMHSDHPGHYSP